MDGPPCSTLCTTDPAASRCHFDCKASYHCSSTAMCNNMIQHANSITSRLEVTFGRSNISEDIAKTITSIENVCKIFAQEDWSCGDIKEDSPICLTCNNYLTNFRPCANHCNDVCHTDKICARTNQIYTQIFNNEYENPEEYTIIKNVADTITSYCSDGYSLRYGFSSIWILFLLFLTK